MFGFVDPRGRLMPILMANAIDLGLVAANATNDINIAPRMAQPIDARCHDVHGVGILRP